MFGFEMLTFNFDDAYPEANVRALSKGFLRQEDYTQLIQCNNLQEFKLVLDETDYGKYIVMADGGNIDSIELKKRMYSKLRDEMEYILGQSVYPLSGFIDHMMHYYQIENVVAFISGVKNNQDPGITKKALNPLGEFAGLKSVSSFASEDFVSLFQDILIDLPVGEYFRKFIDSIIAFLGQAEGGDKKGDERISVEDISQMINDYSASDIKVFLKKIWLISFHRWIGENCNATTVEHMDELLKAESDWETLQIIYNSFTRSEMSDAKGQGLRKKYFNNLGHLYPGRTKRLNDCKDFKEFQDKLEGTSYHSYFQRIPEPKAGMDGPEIMEDVTIDDCQKQDLSRRYSLAFMGQFHYGVFYAYLKLKELEIANIVQLSEIFAIDAFPKNHPVWKKVVPPFQYNLDSNEQQ
jgi:V-type H+-transporting ATPase subunit d